MTEAVCDSIGRVFTDGDLEGARTHLLHTTEWSQHQFTAYGDELISRCWVSWLASCGLSQLEDAQVVREHGQCLQLLTLRPKLGRGPVRVALWMWHNATHVRRLLCHVDTTMMCESLGLDARQLAARLPAPDPLLIEDYDQQAHPHSVDVAPCDLLDARGPLREALQGWWALWRAMQLASVARWYAADAVIRLPGVTGPVTPDRLTSYCSDWFLRLRRHFCQPESVIADAQDPDRIAVLWHLEGDMEGRKGVQRVRIPVINLLHIVDGCIHGDTLLIDEVTLARQLGA